MDENFATLWESLADAMPEHQAIVVGDRRITWHEFDERAARLSAAVADHGVGHDDKVALYLYNSAEYLECVYAAFKARAVPVNVNYRYLDDELVYLLHDSAAKVLVFPGALGERVAAVRDRLPGVVLVQVAEGAPLPAGPWPKPTSSSSTSRRRARHAPGTTTS
jgi:fatty-acyl-CoA synthase